MGRAWVQDGLAESQPRDAGLDLDNAGPRASVAALVIKKSRQPERRDVARGAARWHGSTAGLDKIWLERADRRRVLVVVRMEPFVDADGTPFKRLRQTQSRSCRSSRRTRV